MGLFDWLGLKAPTRLPIPARPDLPSSTEWRQAPVIELSSLTSSVGWADGTTAANASDPVELWRTQPNLRSVVNFLARNIAQLGVHSFTRADNNDRTRVTDDVSALLLTYPNARTTRYELFNALVSDLALWDNAYWFVAEDNASRSGWCIESIPAAWIVGSYGGNVFGPEGFKVQPPDGRLFNLKASDVIHFHGWDPTRPARGTSPVDTLKLLLAEQVQAQTFRRQMWENGGRVGSFITRPKDANVWTDAAATRFAEEYSANYSGSGPKAGRTPILEDGMELKRVGFSANEDQFVEAAKLALTTVASVYHVNPTMLGLLDNANYSNVREFRRMLYGDTLGPWLAMIEDRINTFLLPKIRAGAAVYVEFNIAEKLQGSFEEQATVMQTLVGAPIMTRNEGRARFNLPASDEPGADELALPLNTTTPSSAPAPEPDPEPEPEPPTEPKARPVLVKAAPLDSHRALIAAGLSAFFGSQSASVLSVLGAKADRPWWNAERWDAELAAVLYPLADRVATELGRATAGQLGYSPDSYDRARTVAFLSAVAESRAGAINSTTREQIQKALDDPDVNPATVFETAKTHRAEVIAATFATAIAAFATVEAGSQIEYRARQADPGQPRTEVTKRWVVNSSNPRPEHARMNGQTVPVHKTFSNGADWPGDPVLGADGVAGCSCSVDIESREVQP